MAGPYETRDSYYLGKYAVVIALLVAAWLVVGQIPWLAEILFGLFKPRKRPGMRQPRRHC